MTKQEAIKLEEKVESVFEEYLDEDVEISMALTGKLRIRVYDGFVTFTEQGYPSYVKWDGCYDDLEYLISVIKIVCHLAYDAVCKLRWSYEHQSELIDDGKL